MLVGRKEQLARSPFVYARLRLCVEAWLMKFGLARDRVSGL
jgi:hypothetical protein